MTRNFKQSYLVYGFIIAQLVLKLPFASANQQCVNIQAAQDILNCALNTSPNVIRSEGSLKRSQFLKDEASQIPNPELGFEYSDGKEGGVSATEGRVGLFHTFELGGKRGDRIKVAKSEEAVSNIQLQRSKEDIVLEIVTSLHRLRQLKHEIEITQEALTAFDKIVKRYKKRSRLNPEQEVSYEVFRLSSEDYRILNSSLVSQKNELLTKIQLKTGIEKEKILDFLPKRIESWPELDKQSIEKSSFLNLSKAHLELAKSKYQQAKGNSWPNLRLGPTYGFGTNGGVASESYGVELSIPLPLFNVNGGGRAVAIQEKINAEKNMQLVRRELESQKEIVLNHYQNSTNNLKSSIKIDEIEKRHKSIEKQFFKGLVSSSLVIEAHRQIYDYFTHRHELELEAIASMWKFYALDGTLLDEKI